MNVTSPGNSVSTVPSTSELPKIMKRSYVIEIVFLLTLLAGCSSLQKDVDVIEPFDVIVEIDSQKKTWRNTFTNQLVESCYLPGEVKLGTAENLSNGKQVEIGYVKIEDKLIIETLPGWCDAGTQVVLGDKDGVLQGDLVSRSYSGFEKIGTVVQVE